MDDLQSRLQQTLGVDYRIERELGGGGMSRVFVAEEVGLGRRVVVKVLPPDMAAGLNSERFRREIQLAASLQHPHIVPLIAAGRAGELVWYTMPLIDGESLRVKLARARELPVGEAVRILRDVADALTYAHGQGVVHRDIKPDNILISGRHAVVTDFGVAKAVSESTGESSLTSIGVALGTPAYMAPEQASADPYVDHRADIYALGAMAYEMLTGRPPFDGPPQMVLAAHVTQAPEQVTARRATVPPALAALVMRCLEKKAADRYQTAAEVHEQLELMATPSGGAAPTTATAATLPKPTAGARSLVPVGVAAVIVALAAALFLWRPWARADSGVALSPNVVAVLPFRVAGADPSLQYLRQGMLDLLQAKLTGEGGPRAADTRSVLAAFRDAGGTDQNDLPENTLHAVAEKVGAARILQGSIVGPPEHVVLSATLLAMPGAKTVTQTSVEGPRDSLFVMVDRLTARLLALGAGASAQQLGSLTTTNLDALRAYLDGVAAYRRGAFAVSTPTFQRAVQLDSTFTLALLWLMESHGWFAANTDMRRIQRLAWAYRDRLHDRDRLMLDIRLGRRYPRETPYQETIADRERATQLMPESPDVWYQLGDALFHYGRISGVADAIARSRRAFETAIALDSAYGAPLVHLSTLAYHRRDTAEVRRWANRVIALDSASFTSDHARGELARIDGDREAFLAWLEQNPGRIHETLRYYALDSTSVANDELILRTAQRFATTAADRLNGARMRLSVLWNRGRPAAARALIDSLRESNAAAAAEFDNRLFVAVVAWGEDSTGLGKVIDRLPADDPRVTGWKLLRQDASSARATAARVRTQPAFRDTVSDTHLRGAALIEAWGAVVEQSPNARELVLIADSLHVGWLETADNSPVLARLLDAVGEPRRALSAIRRRAHTLGAPALEGLASALLVEARLAARLGMRADAIDAYRGYLLWRSDPEPSLVPQRDSARAELAQLERAR